MAEPHDLRRVREILAGHVATARRSRSYHFRIPGRGSCYAFSLTWTPGTLVLAGDLGEMTVTHYHALASLWPGLEWAADADNDYLLGKSDKKRSYDQDATLRELIKDANEEAVPALKAFREERAEWRSDPPQPLDPYAWHETQALIDYDWELRGYLENEPKLEITKRHARWPDAGWERGEDTYGAPDGWERWLRIWKALDGYGDPDVIFTARGRAELKERLEDRIGSQHEAAEFIYHHLRYDDWYGQFSWTFHDILQVEAIRYGARMMFAEVEAEDPYRWRAA